MRHRIDFYKIYLFLNKLDPFYPIRRSGTEVNSKILQLTKFGFLAVCVMFTLPIGALFYFMISFKMTSIQFTNEEIAGIQEIGKAYTAQKDYTDEVFQNDIRILADKSNLILDPNLDSYYFVDIYVLRLPGILKSLQLAQISAEDALVFKGLKKELLTSYKKAVFAEERNNKINIELYAIKFYEEFQDFQKSLATWEDSDYDRELAKLSIEKANTFRKDCEIILKSLLQRRNHQTYSELAVAIMATFGFWLICIFGVFRFAKYHIKKFEGLLRELEEQHAALAIAAKMSALGEMSGFIVHEIRSPLAAIKAMISVMRQKIQKTDYEPESFLKRLSQIDELSDRIALIIEAIRKNIRNEDDPKKRNAKLKEIVSDAIFLSSVKLDKTGVHVSVDDFKDYEVFCNEVELSQVFTNLISNATDACKGSSDKLVEIKYNIEGNQLKIWVEDTGPEIPQEIREKMFKTKFTSKAKDEGTGVGLGIVQRILASHDGSIRLLPQKKTCFEIILPFPIEEQRAAA